MSFGTQTETQTSNQLERGHLLVIELEYPIFDFETYGHQTLNLIGHLLELLNYSSKRLEDHFSIIEPGQMCSSFDNRTQTPYF